MVLTIALGSTCRKIIKRLRTPKAFAALTYSKFRARKNSARTTEVKVPQLKSNVISSSQPKLGVMRLAKIIKINNSGKLLQISISLWENKSTLPP